MAENDRRLSAAYRVWERHVEGLFVRALTVAGDRMLCMSRTHGVALPARPGGFWSRPTRRKPKLPLSRRIWVAPEWVDTPLRPDGHIYCRPFGKLAVFERDGRWIGACADQLRPIRLAWGEVTWTAGSFRGVPFVRAWSGGRVVGYATLCGDRDHPRLLDASSRQALGLAWQVEAQIRWAERERLRAEVRVQPEDWEALR